MILEKESRLDKYLCYVLVTELIFGAKKLNGESKPVACVRSYEDRFKEILAELENEDKTKSTGSSQHGDSKFYSLSRDINVLTSFLYIFVSVNGILFV